MKHASRRIRTLVILVALWILARGGRLMAVTDEDASLESVSRRLMAQVYSAKIAEAIDAYRKDRDPAVLLQHGLFAFGATLVLRLARNGGRISKIAINGSAKSSA